MHIIHTQTPFPIRKYKLQINRGPYITTVYSTVQSIQTCCYVLKCEPEFSTAMRKSDYKEPSGPSCPSRILKLTRDYLPIFDSLFWPSN